MAAFYKIVPCANSSLALNVALTGDLALSQTISSRAGVDLQPHNSNPSQAWYIDSIGSNQQILTRTNLVFMLNARRSDWACDVYTSNSDTKINFIAIGDGTYRLQLASNTARYLTAASGAIGSGVVWSALNASSNLQRWELIPQILSPFPNVSSYTSPANNNSFSLYVAGVPAGKIGVVNLDEQGWGIPTPYSVIKSNHLR